MQFIFTRITVTGILSFLQSLLSTNWTLYANDDTVTGPTSLPMSSLMTMLLILPSSSDRECSVAVAVAIFSKHFPLSHWSISCHNNITYQMFINSTQHPLRCKTKRKSLDLVHFQSITVIV